MISHPCWVDIGADLRVAIFEDESCNSGYATRLWDCAIGLSRWMCGSLLDEKHTASEEGALCGWRVLEVGAGTGLCSLALLLVEPSAASVRVTDIDATALPLIRKAAGLLQTHGRSIERLHASLFDICSDQPLPECDLLIACDIMYTVELAAALAKRCLEHLNHSSSACVIVACGGRPARRIFLQALAEQNVHVMLEDVDARLDTSPALSPAALTFAEWLRAQDGDGAVGAACRGRAGRMRVLNIENDARLFGISSVPVMF